MPPIHPLVDTSSFVTLWELPDETWEDRWQRIVVDPAVKEAMLSYALLTLLTLRGASGVAVPMHRMVLLEGPPGTGKTTLARGYANEAARLIADENGSASVFVEVDCFSLSGELLGVTPKTVSKLLEETLPDLAKEADQVFVLFDEIETVATDRRSLSLEVNPVDVHRGTNAFLTGMDYVSSELPNVLTIMTTNYPENLDSAVVSRVDMTEHLDLPDTVAIRQIMLDTAGELHGLLGFEDGHSALDSAVDAAAGLDGRQIRKAIIEAAASDRQVALGHAQLTWGLVERSLRNRRSAPSD
jgi:AAA+ superfamily predicted ATPase